MTRRSPDAELLERLEADPWGKELLASVKVANELYKDPKTGPAFQKLIKEKFPDAQIPELDAASRVDAEIERLRKERNDEKAEREKREREELMARADAWLRDQGLSDEEIKDLKDTMTRRRIGDWEAGLAFWRSQRQLGAPRVIPSPTADIPGRNGAGGEEFKGILENRKGWFANRMHEIQQDFANGQGDKWM